MKEEEQQFIEEMNNYENNLITTNKSYIYKTGQIPVILTAVHISAQIEAGDIKPAEPYTGSIAQYVGDKTNCFYLIKPLDNGVDANHTLDNEFQTFLSKEIWSNGIVLLIDLHGSDKEREYDVEIGTLHDMTCEKDILTSLEITLRRHRLRNIKYNEPFSGGAITKYIYMHNSMSVIQLEINCKLLDINNLLETKKVCDSLIALIKEVSDKYRNNPSYYK